MKLFALFLASLLGFVQNAAVDSPISIPTKYDTATDHLLIRTVVNDVPLWCSLDTGFSALMSLDRMKAATAHLVESAGRPTPDGNAPFRGDGSAVANVDVGSVTLRDQPIIIRDLPASQSDMDCVLGAGLFRQYVIEFDYTTPRIRFHERARYTPPANATTVPLIFRTNPNVPFIQVSLELPDGARRQLQTLFDTGTAYYTLAVIPPASREIRSLVPIAERPVRATTGGGSVQLVAARAQRVTVGPFSVEKPVIALIESGVSAANDDGTLGSGFLNRFTIGFDFVGRRAYLAPNALYQTEQPFDASGVGFSRMDSGFQVEVVLPDSPAARAGLRAGDSLTSVDGMPAASFTLNRLRDRLSRPGPCELRLIREGKPVQIQLTLERRL